MQILRTAFTVVSALAGRAAVALSFLTAMGFTRATFLRRHDEFKERVK